MEFILGIVTGWVMFYAIFQFVKFSNRYIDETKLSKDMRKKETDN